jgi:hypothetical protein
MQRFACFLLMLGLVFRGEISQGTEPEFQVFGDPEEIAFDRHVRQLFQQRLSVRFQNTPLAAVAADLQRQLGVPITLDRKVLEDAGTGEEAPVTFHCQNLAARDILESILRDKDLTWFPQRRYVVISTPEKAASQLITRVYPVADLVAAGNGSDTFDAGLDYDSLIELITTAIAPTTWDEVGGPGSISVFGQSGAIVFLQTHDVHEQVQHLLQALRAARESQGLRVYDYIAAFESEQQRSATFWKQQSQLVSVHHALGARSTAVPGWRLPRRHD